jgi:hypothetical protein
VSSDGFTEQVDAYLRDPLSFPPEYLWWLRRLIEDTDDDRFPEGEAPPLSFFDQVAAFAATRDLLGYWRLGDGASPFLDTSGAAAGPNNMVQTTTGTAMTDSVTGALPTADDDGAVQFNAVSGASGDYLSATDSTFNGDAYVSTAALWVKPTGSYTGLQYIFGTYDTSNGGWAIGMTGRQVFFHRRDAGGNSTVTGPALPNDRWTFVSVDWGSAPGVNIYLNGALVFTGSSTYGIYPFTTLYIGRSGGTANSFQGAVDEASVWGDRLLASEHAALAASGGLVQDPTLRAVTSTTAAYTATSSDDIILANGTFTVTLPTAVGNSGLDLTVKNVGSGTITVAAAGSETIDGSGTVSLAAVAAVTVVSDGTNWAAIGVYP